MPAYFCPQQSPGQHCEPLAQQLAPQQLPGQHFAECLQHAAPVAARAERENSDAARRANSFVFMIQFLSVVEEHSHALARDQAAQNSGSRRRNLDPQIVFQAENIGQTRNVAQHRVGRSRDDLRDHDRRCARGQVRWQIGRVRFLRHLHDALRGYAVCRPRIVRRAARHGNAVAVACRRHRGRSRGCHGDPHSGRSESRGQKDAWMPPSHHELDSMLRFRVRT